MTTDAQLVDRLKKHETVFAGMGVMAGCTSLSENNTMNIWDRFVCIQQIFFILVTGDTNFERAFGPEQIAVLAVMGVMTEGASPN